MVGVRNQQYAHIRHMNHICMGHPEERLPRRGHITSKKSCFRTEAKRKKVIDPLRDRDCWGSMWGIRLNWRQTHRPPRIDFSSIVSYFDVYVRAHNNETLRTFSIREHDIWRSHVPTTILINLLDLWRGWKPRWERLIALLLEQIERQERRLDRDLIIRVAALIKSWWSSMSLSIWQKSILGNLTVFRAILPHPGTISSWVTGAPRHRIVIDFSQSNEESFERRFDARSGG